MTTSLSLGMSRSMFLRLWVRAPRTCMVSIGDLIPLDRTKTQQYMRGPAGWQRDWTYYVCLRQVDVPWRTKLLRYARILKDQIL